MHSKFPHPLLSTQQIWVAYLVVGWKFSLLLGNHTLLAPKFLHIPVHSSNGVKECQQVPRQIRKVAHTFLLAHVCKCSSTAPAGQHHFPLPGCYSSSCLLAPKQVVQSALSAGVVT